MGSEMSSLKDLLAELQTSAPASAQTEALRSFDVGFVFANGERAKAFALEAARAGRHVEIAERLRSPGVWDVVASVLSSRDEASVRRAEEELERLARSKGGLSHPKCAAAA
jgi:hypothetical protein